MSTDGMHSADAVDGPAVGERLVSQGRTITETDVVSFAALTGDWHPQHSDAEWAKAGRFGDRVAHGMLVLSYSIGLVPLDPARVVALRGLRDVVFKRPVHIGDTIRVESQVESVRPLDADTALVDLGWRILNQSDEAVARATIAVIWRAGTAARNDDDGRRSESRPEEVFL
jgi:3-hydroxybutyryl-CoA dehydratase